jgi:hypothetical protein
MTTNDEPGPPVARNAIEAVKHGAARYAGADIHDEAAEKIARMVLECADDHYRLTHVTAQEIWNDQDSRDSLRQHMRRQLFVELGDKGVLPVAWPRELVSPGSPPDVFVQVELIVPVRRALSSSPER